MLGRFFLAVSEILPLRWGQNWGGILLGATEILLRNQILSVVRKRRNYFQISVIFSFVIQVELSIDHIIPSLNLMPPDPLQISLGLLPAPRVEEVRHPSSRFFRGPCQFGLGNDFWAILYLGLLLGDVKVCLILNFLFWRPYQNLGTRRRYGFIFLSNFSLELWLL